MDDEIFNNLDLLINLDELEESDFWDEMMDLGLLESQQSEGTKGRKN